MIGLVIPPSNMNLPKDGSSSEKSSSVVVTSSLQDALMHNHVITSTVVPLHRRNSDRKVGEEKSEAPLEVVEEDKPVKLAPVIKPGSLPPMIPKPVPISSGLRRQQSAPCASQSARRSIFGHYFQRNDGESSRVGSSYTMSPVPTRRRASSISLPASEDWSLLEFSLPEGASSAFLHNRNHFKRVEEVPKRTVEDLPPLPCPLQRFYSEGKATSLGGVYPLCQPKPILRESSYTCLNNEGCQAQSLPLTAERLKAEVYEVFNLTRTLHHFSPEPTEKSDTSTDETSRSTSFSDSSRKVRFDPRVTVTEFPDFERRWFSDADLERFRVETVVLAQRYLIKYPEMIDVYNKPRLDPVTGTMRKKALYTLPALSSVDEGDGLPELSKQPRAMKELAFMEVKKILVVDRNKLILDLFCRSLRLIFPHAHIATAQTSEEAFDLYQKAVPVDSYAPRTGFDIVIAEEHLHKPLTNAPKPLARNSKSSGYLVSLSKAFGDSDESQSVARHDSLLNIASSINCVGVSGSELLRQITEMDASHKTGSRAEASPLSATLNWRPLLIGVSVRPDEDYQKFTDAGADLVWGKPPPIFNEELRDTVVLEVIQKRRRRPAKPSS